MSTLERSTYISTENMLPDKAGVTLATSLPSTEQTQVFNVGDTLVSNIRPYFKKIWYANFDGGYSNDVLVFRPKGNIDSRFLYYVLSDDAFFEYSIATSKGTKMLRGDKKAIMEYPVPIFSIKEQQKIAGILSALDGKIGLNNAINKNLDCCSCRNFPQTTMKERYSRL
ncbi:MAG: restriction endonuclease subunit S [Ruminococcus sp.]|nr:restriction endonuclease subunit S [Ruminococcus sp.]